MRNIPIRNIYHMLCYAWNVLDHYDSVLVGVEKFDNIYNLFTKIYINGTNSLIKRGLIRSYIQEQEEVSTLKGKVMMEASIKAQSFRKSRMYCEYDNFSPDMKLNQIIKATMNVLLKAPQVDWKLKKKLNKQKLYFSGIRDITLTKDLFSTNRFNRNNQHYRMLINISEFIFEGLITKEKGTKLSFYNFIRDKQMAKLYEKFILNFYRKHLDNGSFRVHSPKIYWNLDNKVDESYLAFLPEMRTDIVIENKLNNTQLIIDTKFYTETLVSGYRSHIEKIRTGHLYQIYAYINNSSYAGTVKGMLLYPTITEELNTNYSMDGKAIYIRTLNLDDEWDEIFNRLLSLVNW